MNNYFNALKRKQADLILLVLESQGICADYIKNNNSFDILVKDTDEKLAVQILEKYFAENLNKEYKVSGPSLSWKSPAVFTIMTILSLIHIYTSFY